MAAAEAGVLDIPVLLAEAILDFLVVATGFGADTAALALGLELAAELARAVLVPVLLAVAVLDVLLVAVLAQRSLVDFLLGGNAGLVLSFGFTTALVELVVVREHREVAAVIALTPWELLHVERELPDGVVQLALVERMAAVLLHVSGEPDTGLLQADGVEKLEAEQVHVVHESLLRVVLV